MNRNIFSRTSYFFSSIVALLISSATTLGQTLPPGVHDSIQVRLDAVCAANPTIKGGILKVEKVGQWSGVWTYGVRDTVTNTPITGDERYRIGSVSKNFLATAILKLASVNALSLDDTIGLFLPPYITAVIPYHSSITVRHLLRHTSGMADAVNDPASTLPLNILANPFLTRPFDTLMLHYFAPLTPQSAPGDTSRYSNTNYWILGKVIESVTGVSYDRYIDSVIINPLGLAHTYIPALQDSSIALPYLHGYTDLGGTMIDASFENMSWAFSAGSVISTIEDVSTYYKALRSGTIIPANWVDSMMNCTASAPASMSPYKQHFGYGVFEVTNTADNIHYMGHNGEVPGYSSIMYYYPQHNTYITATVGADPEDYVDILAILIDEYLDELANTPTVYKASDKIMLWPMPCQDGLHIETNLDIDHVKIYDMQSRILKDMPYIKSAIIPTTELASGNYIVEVISTASMATNRVLVTVSR